MTKIIIGSIFLFAGIIAGAISIKGIYGFKFVMNRMHAAAIVDSAALLFIIVGLIIISLNVNFVFKLLLVIVFQWLTSPIAAHMVMRLENETDKDAKKHYKKENNKWII